MKVATPSYMGDIKERRELHFKGGGGGRKR
jgi:hypothetical protein